MRDTFSDEIGPVEITCIDVGMPMVIAQATSLGKTGYETKAKLEADSAFMDRIEAIRREAGAAMGMGDVSRSIIPKFAIVSPPKGDGHLTSCYFTVHGTCHAAYAVSGSICASTCAALPGSVVAEVTAVDERFPNLSRIEHPSGVIDVTLNINQSISRAVPLRSSLVGFCVRRVDFSRGMSTYPRLHNKRKQLRGQRGMMGINKINRGNSTPW